MTDLTDYAEESFINWSFGGQDMAIAHSNVYVALHTGSPSNSGEANEVSASDYDRAETSANGDWDRSGNEAENATEINFGVASSSWGNISHFSIWDSATDGNAIWQSDLEQSKEVEENDEIRFDAGNLTAEIN